MGLVNHSVLKPFRPPAWDRAQRRTLEIQQKCQVSHCERNDIVKLKWDRIVHLQQCLLKVLLTVFWKKGSDVLPSAGEQVFIRVAENYGVGFYDHVRKKFLFNSRGSFVPISIHRVAFWCRMVIGIVKRLCAASKKHLLLGFFVLP